jgi:hypothetical protein
VVPGARAARATVRGRARVLSPDTKAPVHGTGAIDHAGDETRRYFARTLRNSPMLASATRMFSSELA